MFSPDQWAASTGVAFYNGVATQSLRFDSGSTTYLNKTFSSAGNQQSWTWSGWVKRSKIGTAYNQHLFGVQLDGSNIGSITFRSNDTLKVNNKTGNTNGDECTTNAVFRDVSAWYHIVVSFDGSQSTQANRTKIYVNGVLQDKVTNLALSAGNGYLNTNAKEHSIGARRENSTDELFDGYIAEMNFVDGSSLDPTSFGELKNGVWIPINYAGGYGGNGFRLQFNETGTGTASSSTIGADTSGNANHFSSSGIVASDCDMPDSPENNFNTQNPLSKQTYTFAEGNLKLSRAGGTSQSATIGTISVPSGKWYWEVKLISGQSSYPRIGMFNTALGNNHIESKYPANNDFGARVWGSGGGTNLIFGDSNTQASFGSYTNGDVLQFALDMDNYKMYMGKNDTWYTNSATTTDKANISDSSANPAFGSVANLDINAGDSFTPCIFANAGADIWVANFGQDSTFAGAITAGGNTDANGIGDFYYSPPSGYLALCTANLPEPTISPNADTQADDHFNTVIYDGNNDATRTFDIGFVTDFAWFKARNQAGYGHNLYDSVRGVQKYLQSNTTGAEIINTEGVTDFDDNGLLKIGTDAFINESGTTMVLWNWKAGGTAVSNTDGSITSSVSANTDAGFSIVSYTGSGSGTSTVGHSLGKKPDLLIVKSRDDADNWLVGSDKISGWNWYSDYLHLQATSAKMTDANGSGFNSAPTSTVFSVGAYLNGSSENYIAYLFTSIDGYSSINSYTGNGSADGTFIYTGFRPAFVLFKRTDTTGNGWGMKDTVRDSTNPNNGYLFAESNGAEGTATSLDIDFLSNGLKFRGTSSDGNASGGTYIYMSFAENPFKYANAR
jgi:hypothetical protein